MKGEFILEVAVESMGAALAAERGGADRVELCADLRAGGITPNLESLREARSTLTVPIHIMIRPRPGNFVYNRNEFAEMRFSIALAHREKMDGVVLGILRSDKTVDVQSTRELVEFARPLQVTFHRAFDECTDLLNGLEDVVSTGATRILTSGGKCNVPGGMKNLQTLLRAAGERIVIMPGGGIQPGNFLEIRQTLRATEFHTGLSTVLAYGTDDFLAFEAAVRSLKDD